MNVCKALFPVSQKTLTRRKRRNKMQDVGEDLSVCILTLLARVSTLRVGGKSRQMTIFPCLVGKFSPKWIYDVFSFWSDLTRPHDEGIMQIYGWDLHALCHHRAKMVNRFIVIVETKWYTSKGLCIFMSRNSSR